MLTPSDTALTFITDSGSRTVTAHPGCLTELVDVAAAHTGHTTTAQAIVVALLPRILLMQSEGIVELRE